MNKYPKLIEESKIVQIFRNNKIHLWFREEINNPQATINNLPLNNGD